MGHANRLSRWLGVGAIAAAMVVASGCGSSDSGGGSDEGAGGAIPIGVVVSKTGAFSDYGIGEEAAIRVAVREINDNGGLGGRPIDVLIRDDASRPDQAISVTRELIERDRVAAVIGPGLSTTAEAAFPIANASEIPAISPSIVSEKAAPENRPWTFTIGAPADIIFEANLDTLQRAYPDVRRVAVVVDPECAGCVAETGAMSRLLRENGYELLNDDPIALRAGAPDQSAQATSIARLDPDAVLGSAGPVEWALLAKELQRRGLRLPAFSGTGPSAPEFLSSAGTAGNGWTVLSAFHEQSADPRTRAFVAAMRPVLDDAKQPGAAINSADALYYDAAIMLQQVLDRAALADDASLDELRTAIRDGLQEVEYQGVGGEMQMRPDGRMALRGHLLAARDGAWQRLGD